jgi:hypothetical protein
MLGSQVANTVSVLWGLMETGLRLDGLYVLQKSPTGPDSGKKIVCYVWSQALQDAEELPWFPVAHFLMRHELSQALCNRLSFFTLDWGGCNCSAATTGLEPEPPNLDKYR